MLVITGPCGVGKTSTAAAVGEALERISLPGALVDMDELRRAIALPQEPDDPFRMRLAFRNLSSIWANYFEFGARYLIASDVVEGKEHVEMWKKAIPDAAEFKIVRLEANMDTIHFRLEQREKDPDSRKV